MHDLKCYPWLSLFRPQVVIILIFLFLPGCTGKRPTSPHSPATSSPSAEYRPVTGPATTLFIEAEKALQSGQYTNAEMLLERALRIEPQNPHYWHALARVKYRQDLYPQTIQFCLKTDSLAKNQTQLSSRNRELLMLAQKAIGSQ